MWQSSCECPIANKVAPKSGMIRTREAKKYNFGTKGNDARQTRENSYGVYCRCGKGPFY